MSERKRGKVEGSSLRVACYTCGMRAGERCVQVWVGDPLKVGESHDRRVIDAAIAAGLL